MIDGIGERINKKIWERDSLCEKISGLEKRLTEMEKRETNIDSARVILQTVAEETQITFIERITDIVSSALDAVFGSGAYQFKIEFVQRRNKTEADIYFIRDGNRLDPLTSSGGGPVDVASFALRVALWSLLRQSSGISDTIILDEPFKFLSRDLRPLAGDVLKSLSEKLGVQFIYVTHVQDLVDAADRVFDVSIKGGISIVEVS